MYLTSIRSFSAAVAQTSSSPIGSKPSTSGAGELGIEGGGGSGQRGGRAADRHARRLSHVVDLQHVALLDARVQALLEVAPERVGIGGDRLEGHLELAR